MHNEGPRFHVKKIFCQPSTFIQASTFIREVRVMNQYQIF